MTDKDPLHELDHPESSPEAIEYKNLCEQIYILASLMDSVFYALEDFRNDWEDLVQKAVFKNDCKESK